MRTGWSTVLKRNRKRIRFGLLEYWFIGLLVCWKPTNNNRFIENRLITIGLWYPVNRKDDNWLSEIYTKEDKWKIRDLEGILLELSRAKVAPVWSVMKKSRLGVIVKVLWSFCKDMAFFRIIDCKNRHRRLNWFGFVRSLVNRLDFCIFSGYIAQPVWSSSFFVLFFAFPEYISIWEGFTTVTSSFPNCFFLCNHELDIWHHQFIWESNEIKSGGPGNTCGSTCGGSYVKHPCGSTH